MSRVRASFELQLLAPNAMGHTQCRREGLACAAALPTQFSDPLARAPETRPEFECGSSPGFKWPSGQTRFG